jgi:DNA polymerase elongation subunit (family B)
MIQQGMYPPQIGPVFIQVFKQFYDRRIDAKRQSQLLLKSSVPADILLGKKLAKDAETLKIVLNGTFGKTGEKGGRAIMYYPEMMIQVTLSGQLSLLMLIEWFEMNGIEAISANTDGVTVKCHRSKLELKNEIIRHWEKVTGLGMESVTYKAIYSRDVNNYIAIYNEPKGLDKDATPFRHAKAIGAYRNTTDVYPMKWNPVTDVCKEALIEYLATGKPVDEYVRGCTDFRKFLEVRRVAGGAVKEGEYLGKAIRWYYAVNENGEIINAKNGHVVPRSQGAKPCMTMPDELPEDIDHDFYVKRALSMLEDFQPKVKKEKAAA